MPSIRNGYVTNENERIIRGSSYPYLNWSRATLLLVFTLVLSISNPGNNVLLQDVKNPIYRIFNKLSSTTTTTSASSPSSSPYSYFQRPQQGRITNYGLFSIEEKIGSLNLLALQNSWKCPQNNINFAPICDIIGRNMTHQKPFLYDEYDLVHTIHRLICITLIISVAYFYCCPGRRTTMPWWVHTSNNIKSIFGWTVCSIFYNTDDPINLTMNLLYMNTCVYPTLVELYRIIPRVTGTTNSASLFSFGNTNLDYIVAVCFLLCGIGGGTNYITSKLMTGGSGRRINQWSSHASSNYYTYYYGFNTVIASSLAYFQQVTRKRPIQIYLFHVLDQPLTAGTIFWTCLVLTLLSASDVNWLPSLVAWSIAGCAGSIFGQYHVNNQIWWGGVVDYFRWF